MATRHQPLWSLSTDEVLELLETGRTGLSTAEALRRREQYGANELPEPPRRALWLRFIDQLTHFMALLLWIAGILAFVSRTPELGWAIWAVIWINAVFSFWQEYQAEQALEALKRVLPAQVRVYRDNALQLAPARELVRGDIVQLEEGDRVSADARLLTADNLYVDVSALTGESLPVARSADALPFHEAVRLHGEQPVLRPGEQPLQERVRPAELANLVLAGSTIVAGRAIAVVYATGSQTEFGHVAHLTTAIKREPSSLELQIARIVRIITAIAVSMGVLVFLLSSTLIGMEVVESFVFAIGIIVANVPEGLLPTVTLVLALGVQRMARRNALVRRLSAVESLSATSVICTDKTGTLTKNEMTVRYLWLSHTRTAEEGPAPPARPARANGYTSSHQHQSKHLPSGAIEITGAGYDPGSGSIQLPDGAALPWQVNMLLAGAALCSNARLIQLSGPGRWQEIGDPTEAALLVAAAKAGLNMSELQQQLPRQREVPFDSRRRMMTVVLDWRAADWWPNQSPYLAITKGAPLEVLRHCRSILHDNTICELSQQDWDRVVAANDGLAAGGLRVLAVAARKGGQELLALTPQELEQELIFVGLTAMFDPPRPEVPEAIAHCHAAGIKITMVTGDYGLTAESIARQIGLVGKRTRVVTGEMMRQLSQAQLRQTLTYRSGLVFARMAPEDKLRLVQTYKQMGEVVAVTGDGINDAPALRAGNIGVAMGLDGTDVAREAADIVLADDNFASIVSAIEQGRTTYYNIRKFMTYILASNIPEIMPFLAMLLFKIPPALTILQILAIDLGTDMVPALALGAEPPEARFMQQPPRATREPLLNLPLLARAYGFLGLIEGTLAMLGFWLVWWSYGYSFAMLQQVTPAILSHTAAPHVAAIYAQATTMTLAVIVACQVGNLFACRSERGSSLRLSWTSNRLLWLGLLVECSALLACIYLPPLSRMFQTAPLAAWQWLSLLACPPLMLGAEELRKWLVRRDGRRQTMLQPA